LCTVAILFLRRDNATSWFSVPREKYSKKTEVFASISVRSYTLLTVDDDTSFKSYFVSHFLLSMNIAVGRSLIQEIIVSETNSVPEEARGQNLEGPKKKKKRILKRLSRTNNVKR
jgi:hypothetical protein